VFDNSVLKKIFGLMKQEVTEGWRKVYNDKLHNLYSPPCIIRAIERKRPLRRFGHR
jgi:hypothetical protein